MALFPFHLFGGGVEMRRGGGAGRGCWWVGGGFGLFGLGGNGCGGVGGLILLCPILVGRCEDGFLYGRGAFDMKGGIACQRRRCADYLAPMGQPGQKMAKDRYSISDHRDEEDISVNGTIKLLRGRGARREIETTECGAEPSQYRRHRRLHIKVGRREFAVRADVRRGVQGT